MIKKRLKTSIEYYNNLVKESIIKGDPKTYTAFLLGQATAYENILKEICTKEIKSKEYPGHCSSSNIKNFY